MSKTVSTLLIVFGLALLLTALSTWAFPGWLDTDSGGVLALVGVAFWAVVAVGGKLKDWREFLFPNKEGRKSHSASSSENEAAPSVDISGNWMIGSNTLRIWKNRTRVAMNKLIGKQHIEVHNGENDERKP